VFEEGRWHARSVYFDSARHAAYPELRRRKSGAALGGAVRARPCTERRVGVGARKGRPPRHPLANGAQADVFSERPSELALLRNAFPLQPGQSGALLALGERLRLDYVSRPEAFARLYPKLLEGYLLDAFEVVDGPPAGDLDAFIAAIAEGAVGRRPSAGLGEDVRLRGEGVVASGLVLDGELLQLCAFSSEEPRGRTRIARPSRRS
jgi:ARG and Rhodanese-Phosphatase-superfamily-associated Protein domain